MTVDEVITNALTEGGIPAASVIPATGGDAYKLEVVNRASSEILHEYRARLPDEGIFTSTYTHDFPKDVEDDTSADVLSLNIDEQVTAVFVKYSADNIWQRAEHVTRRVGSSPIEQLRKLGSPAAPVFFILKRSLYLAPRPTELVAGGIRIITRDPITTLTALDQSISGLLDDSPDTIITLVLTYMFRRIHKLRESQAMYENHLRLRELAIQNLAGRVSTTQVITDIPNFR